MGKKRFDKSQPRDNVEFFCSDCLHRWTSEPDSHSFTESTYHPVTYTCECPECGQDCSESDRYRARLKAWASSTGPRTAEGKAASANNLKGFPTDEQRKHIRFNALKTGQHAEVATFFPAKPGKYSDCESCEFRYGRCIDQYVVNGPCLKKAELFHRHWLAFDRQDPLAMKDILAKVQWFATSLIESMFLDISRDGTTLRSPKYYVDKKGDLQIAEYFDEKDGELVRRIIEEVNAHPLIKPFTELLSRNYMSLHDAGLTLRQHEQEQSLPGYLDDDETESLSDFQEQQAKSVEQLKAIIYGAQDDTNADPVLLEHGEDHG